jgi:hypothetical protein
MENIVSALGVRTRTDEPALS